MANLPSPAQHLEPSRKQVKTMPMFANVGEAAVTKAIVSGFARDFQEYITSDVIIVGGGPSGLMAARDLCKKGVKTLVIEQNNYIGGGFWIGGYLMNKNTFRAPSQKILDEIGCPYEEASPGLYMVDGPHACSSLIKAACDAGAKIINMTQFDDVIFKDGKIAGAVINWTPVNALPHNVTCVDPIAMESKIVLDATGHDACVVQALAKRRLVDIPGMNPMWVEASEQSVVEKTGYYFPGLYLSGMSVATAHGLPRMGPTFGAMLLSGRKAAQEIIKALKNGGTSEPITAKAKGKA